MSVLLERPEITPFIAVWKGKPQEQVVEELASYSLETQSIPDPYYFLMDKDGDLFSPSAQTKVRNSIIRETKIGRLEAQAFDAISAWFKANTLGTIAWISPPSPGIYPISKVIISNIEQEGGRKRLYNRAILFDFNEEESLEFAQNLSRISQNKPLLSHLDGVRSTPLILDTDSKFWMYILQELIDDPKLWQSIRTGEDQLAKQKALIQAKSVYRELFSVEHHLVDKLVLGTKPTSCPVLLKGTAFQLFSENSLSLGTINLSGSDQYGSLEFECPKCKRKNSRPHGKLVPSCQYTNCKADVRC